MKNLRRLGNLVISREQLRWLLLIAGFCAICYFVLASVVASSFYAEIADASQNYEVPPVFIQKLYAVLHNSVLALTLTALVLTILTTLVAMVVTHRFFGPMVPMKRFVSSLQKGDYSARLSLRSADELHELANELNQLAVELEKRHGK